MSTEAGTPRSATHSHHDVNWLLDHACRQAGYQGGGRLLRRFSNAVYLLDAAPVVARVACGRDAAATACTSLGVVRWLIEQGFPAAAPTDPPSGVDQPITIDQDCQQTAVTFWRYHPQPAGQRHPDAAALGRLAARLHKLPVPPIPLPRYEPLQSLRDTLAHAAEVVLNDDHRAWLTRRVSRVREAFTYLDFPLENGLIHADMVTGNLLWNSDAASHEPVLLCDWDSVCIGPREVDLIPIHHEPRFGAQRGLVSAFVDSYGYDLSQWSGYPIFHEIRELSTLAALILLAQSNSRSAAELRHRVDSLVRGDHEVLWHAQ
jgi:Ser/Thr protein kinase RdoA (MazF antagonist)